MNGMEWLLVWNGPKYEVVIGWSKHIFPYGMKWHKKWSEHGMKCLDPLDEIWQATDSLDADYDGTNSF